MAKKRLYYQIDFENCDSFDFVRTVVSDLPEINNYLQGITEGGDFEQLDTSVTITGIWMTEKQYAAWVKKYVTE